MAFSRYSHLSLTGSWFIMLVILCRTNNGYMRLCVQVLVIVPLVFISAPVLAAQLSFKPSLEIRETYTDNVTFSDPGKADFITEVNPSLALQADGNRLNASVGYTLQNIFYAKGSRRDTRFHNLAADATAELINDFAFLNLKASDSQRVISPAGGLPLDNLNAANRTDVSARSIKPYFKKRFGGKAEGSASYSYEALTYGGGASDAEIEAVTVELDSGPSFRRMSWSLSYSQNTTKREETSNYSRESSALQASYQINKKLGALFRAGNERNDLATPQNQGFRNGSYYASGISITPHSTFRVDLLSGNRLDTASISWAPTRRSALDISWRDQKVGLNPGKVWQGAFRVINRRATWRASYLEDTTSVQGLQSLGSGTQGAQSANLSSSALPLSDELFLRKRAQMDFGYKTAKSLISVALYNERRELLVSNDNQQLRGGTVSWRWRFAARTTMLLRFRGLKSEYPDGAGARVGANLRSTEINFSRKMGRSAEGSVMVRSTSQDGLAGGRSYDEKRLSVGVKWGF